MVSLKADIINSVMATTFQTFCLWEVANQKKRWLELGIDSL